MREGIYICVPLVIAVALRLYPYLISGLPFSVDAWQPIRNTELLLENTPIHLGDDRVFDGYNNYWPANSLFGAMVSQVTGLQPIQAMAIFLPIAGAMTIPIFYVLIRRLYNAKISFIASVIFATACTHSILTAGVTKETYASPLYILLILLFLHQTMGDHVRTLLFTIASTSLVLAHHLTAFLSIASLAAMAIGLSMDKGRKGVHPESPSLLLPSILTGITTLYLWLYAHRVLRFPFTVSDWLSAVSYQVVALALAIYLTLKPSAQTRARTALTCSMAAALTLLLTVFTMKRPIVPGAPTLPSRYLLYATPFILASPLMALGHGGIREMRGARHAATTFWLAAILGLEGYAVFGNSGFGLALAYRGVNFLLPPLAILCAAGLHRLYATVRKPRTPRLVRLAVVTALLVIVTLNSYSVYAAVSLEERYMGYFWLYKTHEYEAGAWIATTANHETVAGDVKVSYLLNGYFNVKVDVLQGLRFLTGKGSSKPPILLLVYDQMLRNGYVLHGGYSIDLPENWMERASQLNLVYSNGIANVYAG